MSKNEKIGYGRPPQATRFKRGKSGNPRGRPKGARSRGIDQDLLEELTERVTVREGDREKRLTKQRALVKQWVAKGLKGDNRANSEIFKLVGRTGADAKIETVETYDEVDLYILRKFTPAVIASLERKLAK